MSTFDFSFSLSGVLARFLPPDPSQSYLFIGLKAFLKYEHHPTAYLYHLLPYLSHSIRAGDDH